MLIKYLREMNFTDDVIRGQAVRMKTLLDDWPPVVTVPTAPQRCGLCSRPPSSVCHARFSRLTSPGTLSLDTFMVQWRAGAASP